MTDLLPSVAEVTQSNGAFSRQIPGLQLAWDSTSLGAFKTCPRFYQYQIIYGLVPRAESVHLRFGLELHSALELYQRRRASGLGHQAATREAVRSALISTWDSALGRPWAPDYPGPKNRLTLIRTIVWYLEQFGENDPLVTVQLASGQPAVELSFRFDIGAQAPSGESFQLCGHMDRLATLNDQIYVTDVKTTEHTLSPSYFARFSPDNQFSIYTLAGKIAFGEPISGLIVDPIQVAVTFSRIGERQLIPRDEAQLGEVHRDLIAWMWLAAQYARVGYWPMNDKSCFRYGRMCEFAGICSKSPASRDQWLTREFATRVWDPTIARGDF